MREHAEPIDSFEVVMSSNPQQPYYGYNQQQPVHPPQYGYGQPQPSYPPTRPFPAIQVARPQRPYSGGKRAFYGVTWAIWTALFIAGGFAALAHGQVGPGLLGLVLGGIALRYDYRIWTWQARWLMFLIIY